MQIENWPRRSHAGLRGRFASGEEMPKNLVSLKIADMDLRDDKPDELNAGDELCGKD